MEQKVIPLLLYSRQREDTLKQLNKVCSIDFIVPSYQYQDLFFPSNIYIYSSNQTHPHQRTDNQYMAPLVGLDKPSLCVKPRMLGDNAYCLCPTFHAAII